jgi:voltage-gated potassium channel
MKSTLALQLLTSTGIVGSTIVIHLIGILLLLRLLQLHVSRLRSARPMLDRALVILGAAFGLFLLHALEIWIYAVFYVAVREIPNLEDALYFSTSTYATIGYGDVVLSRRWRLLGAIEGVSGVILLGWSTAFFFSIIQRLRTLEQDWLNPGGARPKLRDRPPAGAGDDGSV